MNTCFRFCALLALAGLLAVPQPLYANPASESVSSVETLSATTSSSITRSDFIAALAAKNMKSPFVPENALSLNKEDLYKAVVDKMSQQGISFLPADGGNEPLTRIEFIDVTYSFVTGQAGNTFIERKYFLRDKKILKTDDIGSVKSFEGLVNISRFNEEAKIQLKNYLVPVLFKDTVETDEDSRVKIELDDASYLNVGEDTSMEINKMVYDPVKNTRETLITVAYGKIRVKASKLSSEKRNFSIHTPTAVIGIRGTEFIVAVHERGRTEVVTIEGLVAVRPIKASDIRRQQQRQTGKQETTETESSDGTTDENADVTTETTDESTESTETTTESVPENTPEEVQDDGSDDVMVASNSAVTVDEGSDTMDVVSVSDEVIGGLVQETEVLNPVVVENTGFVTMEEATEAVESEALTVAVAEVAVAAETASTTEAKTEETTAEPEIAAEEIATEENDVEAVDTSTLAASVDTDGDGVADVKDAFPNDPSESKDTDSDGYGDNGDAFPNDAAEWLDTDGDGYGDNFADIFPSDANEWADTDGDGYGDNSDVFPNNVTEWADTDGNGIGNNTQSTLLSLSGQEFVAIWDTLTSAQQASLLASELLSTAQYDLVVDTDGDGVVNSSDAFPNDVTDWADTDGNGIGNNAQSTLLAKSGQDFVTAWNALTASQQASLLDLLSSDQYALVVNVGATDTDGDGVIDDNDAFPNNPDEWADDDNNGIGNNAQAALLALEGSSLIDSWDPLSWSQKLSLLSLLNGTQFSTVLDNELTTLKGDKVPDVWNSLTADQKTVFSALTTAKKKTILDNTLNGLDLYQRPLFSSTITAEKLEFNATSVGEISGDDYIPDTYQYGLQVGSDYMNADTLNAINSDGFLAYAVQVEEDIVNKEALSTIMNSEFIVENYDEGEHHHHYRHHQHDDAEDYDSGTTQTYYVRQSLLNDISTTLQSGDIRQRDALLAQENDAKAGRVLLDANGYWVRVQQYVLRPNDNVVQVVNVSLRGAEAGSIEGMSVMNWQTAFAQALPSGSAILALPWADYLHTTRHDGDAYVTNNSNYELAAMSVEFKHGNDSLQEARTFDNEIEHGRQDIDSETLTVNGNAYQYDSHLTSNDRMKYTIVMVSGGQLKFRYQLRDDHGHKQEINAYFYIVGNATSSSNSGVVSGYDGVGVSDVWEALSANMSTANNAGPNIGSNNLEMRFTNRSGTSLLNAPIDIVYIPLPNMEWKAPVQ